MRKKCAISAGKLLVTVVSYCILNTLIYYKLFIVHIITVIYLLAGKSAVNIDRKNRFLIQ